MAKWCGEEVFQQDDIVCDCYGENWRILNELGSGRCCIAYRVQSVNEPNIVKALKVYHEAENYAACSNTESYVVKLVKSRGFNADNIVNVEARFESQGHQCLLVELLSSTLNQIRVDNSSGIHLYLITKALKDVLNSLVSLHECSLIHGDIKSNNVMWSAQESCFKVFDFGLSFAEGQNINHQIQSLFYRAPEASEWNKRLMLERSRRQTLASYYLTQPDTTPTHSLHSQSDTDDADEDGGTSHSPTSKLVLSNELLSAHSVAGDERDSIIHTVSNRVKIASNIRLISVPERRSHVPHIYSDTSGRGENSSRVSGFGSRVSVVMCDGGVDKPVKKRKITASCSAGSSSTSSSSLWRPIERVVCGSSGKRKADSHDDNESITSAALPPPLPPTWINTNLTRTVDLFSVGCLILEMFCGKLESVNFRNSTMSGVCIACLANMGEMCSIAMAAYDKVLNTPNNEDVIPIVIHDLANLVRSLLQCHPEKRLSAKAALKHPFFAHKMNPSISVLTYLSSSILRLDDLIDDDQLLYEYTEDYNEIIQGLQERCEKIGPVKIVFIPREGHGRGKAYIHFTFAHHCERAFLELRGRIFNGRHLQPSFYPLDLWEKRIFI